MLTPRDSRCTGLASALLTLLLTGCGGGHHDSEPGAAPAATIGQATVDATGGTVVGPDQVSLSIAPDSVAGNTTFRIARDASQAPPLVGMTLLSPIYAITPHGAAFDPHAMLSLPFDASKLPMGATAVVLRGETGGRWHVQPNRGTQAGVAVADVGDLSWYAVGVCTPGDAGLFGFGLGDCPANHSLTLEYLDGQGGAIPVPRDAQGRALPFLPDITTPTDVKLRLTWTRPPGVNRQDTITLFLTDANKGPLISSMGPVIGDYSNQPVYAGNVTVRIDPAKVPGAGLGKGKVARFGATASYCAEQVFTHQNICWYFDADLVFRVHDVTPDTTTLAITQQPHNASVVSGHNASFHVEAQGLLTGQGHIEWERLNAGGNTWVAAGGTQSADGMTLTLTTDEARDNGAEFRARACNLRVSGFQTCTDPSNAAQLTVTSFSSGAASWPQDGQPIDQSVPEHTTVDVLMKAEGVPYATVEIWQVKAGTETLLKTCYPARISIAAANVHLAANPTVCSHHLPDPVTLTDSGTQFYGKAYNDWQAAPVPSRHATLTVTSAPVAPSFVTQPGAVQTTLGGLASFTATATGSAPLSYAWWFQDAAHPSQPPTKLADRSATTSGTQTSGIQGSGSPTLALSNVQPADVGDYVLVVGNGTPPAATSQSAALTLKPRGSNTRTLAAGTATTCTAMGDATVSCWGSNTTGQLGDGTLVDKSTPTPVTGLSQVQALAVGRQHGCAVKTDGTVACWGDNSGGQLGNGGAPSPWPPTAIAVPGLGQVVTAAAGAFHTCVAKADGSVACWGSNNTGQLGDGTTTRRSAPTTVPGLTGVIALASGYEHSCAARSNGSVACWGRNNVGQLGTGDTVDHLSPIDVPGLNGVVALVAAEGHGHTCALKADGSVVCWGLNAWGQLGDGTGVNRWVPTAVTGLGQVIALAAGLTHTCAAKADGTLVCWGQNIFGQLGDGVASNHYSPATVPGVTGVTALTAGDHHTCAAKADGAMACWGENNHGQLGDGTTVEQHVPTAVLF